MDICPHCGESVPDRAQACPYCGSDFETGWNPDADHLSVELPEDDFPGPVGPTSAWPHSTTRSVRGNLVLGTLAVVFAFTAAARCGTPVTLACGGLLAVSFWLFQKHVPPQD